MEQLAEPAVDTAQVFGIEIVLGGVGIGSRTPILRFQEPVTKDPDIAQCERQAAAKARIACSRGIADKHDPIPIWPLDPGIRCIERGQWPDHRTGREPGWRCAGRDGQFNELRFVFSAAERPVRVVAENNVGAEPTLADREDDR